MNLQIVLSALDRLYISLDSFYFARQRKNYLYVLF